MSNLVNRIQRLSQRYGSQGEFLSRSVGLGWFIQLVTLNQLEPSKQR